MPQLVGARLLQGLAGGGVITMFRSLIGDIASPRERGRYQWMASGVWIAAIAMIVLHYGVPTDIATLLDDQRRIVIGAFESGLTSSFRLLVIFGVIGLLLAFVVTQEPLRESMD
jgi:MFS family permease